MTLERRLEKAANNQDVLDVIKELIKLSETNENNIEGLEAKVVALEEKLKEQKTVEEGKPGFFSLGD